MALAPVVKNIWGLALILAGCDDPDYPSDWTAIQPANVESSDKPCPDLSGVYALPRMITGQDESGRATTVVPNTFLTALAGKAESGLMTSNIGLSRMSLEGPTEQSLKVVFYDKNNQILSRHRLREGLDYLCLGAWISDAKPKHTRAKPPLFYAKDIDGRLVGHTAYSKLSVTLLLGILPAPTYINDRTWWRIERIKRDD